MKEKELSNNFLKNQESLTEDNLPFCDLKYICQANLLITASIRNGHDVIQLSNGNINVTEVKIINVHYSWDAEKEKFIKTNQVEYNNLN